jgi:hypothetical protein
MVLIFVVAASRSLSAQNSQSAARDFKWLDPAKDGSLYERIRAVFDEELKPDDPEKVKPVEALLYKKLSRIGVFQSSALVLILERETATSKYGEYLRPFNYDLKTGEKSALGTGFYPLWEFNKLVRFEQSTAPDIAFTYWSCTECEADHFVSSFRFDPADGKWKVRSWTNSDPILIGDDGKPLPELEVTNHDCLYRFGDFTGDGFEDLAVRCLAIDQADRVVDDTTTLYSVRHGQPQAIAVKNPVQLAMLREKLCANIKKSKLCPPK